MLTWTATSETWMTRLRQKHQAGALFGANALRISCGLPCTLSHLALHMKNGFVVPLHINNNTLPHFFFAVVLHFFFTPSDFTRPLFLCCHVACYHRRDKWGARGREGASGARVLASSPLPLIASVPALALSPPSYRLPEWQLAASRVQWACQPPRCGYLPTDLRKIHILNVTESCVLRLPVLYRCTPFGAAWTHAAHIAARRALWPLKHATVRPFKWILWDRPEAKAMRAAPHKKKPATERDPWRETDH